ncbi:hypothetical protein ACOSP7_003413 [Xanthoceras sorbifolium]
MAAWWSFLWSLSVPAKIKIFIWRACDNWLPVMTNLAARRVPVSHLCPLCCHRPETTVHALLGCPLLHSVCKSIPCLQASRWDDNVNLFDILFFYMKTLRKESFLELVVVF